MNLTNLFVCSICEGELNIEQKEAICLQCGRFYPSRQGVFDFTPIPPPDTEVLDNWSLWEELQANGLVSYTEAPELNLSVGSREDCKAFSKFAQPEGLVLDVGCGPQEQPAYAVDFPGELFGIDPLFGKQPRNFHFVQGIGEYLPFRQGTFNQVLFGTTLDHMLSPKRALAEARRVLQPDGAIIIWFGEINGVNSQLQARLWSKWRKGLTLLRQGDIAGLTYRLASRLGLSLKPSYLSRLAVPDGAVDHFHFFHMDWTILEMWLKEADLTIADFTALENTNSRFVRAIPTR
jgi:SAM-dependent methyltransferase